MNNFFLIEEKLFNSSNLCFFIHIFIHIVDRTSVNFISSTEEDVNLLMTSSYSPLPLDILCSQPPLILFAYGPEVLMFKHTLLLLLFVISVGCQDYVASKREGMKPFHDESERQAEEDPSTEP